MSKGIARHDKITGKPRAGSKWNRAEIEPIIKEIRSNPRIRKLELAVKYGIEYSMLLKKITAYHAGELK